MNFSLQNSFGIIRLKITRKIPEIPVNTRNTHYFNIMQLAAQDDSICPGAVGHIRRYYRHWKFAQAEGRKPFPGINRLPSTVQTQHFLPLVRLQSSNCLYLQILLHEYGRLDDIYNDGSQLSITIRITNYAIFRAESLALSTGPRCTCVTYHRL